MLIRTLTVVSLSLLLTFCSGCMSAYATAELEIVINNQTAVPLSVGLVKNGPPLEESWAAPHEVAINAPQLSDRRWGQLVPPGHTLRIGPVTGYFGQGVSAMLRVYAADLPIDQLMSIARGDADRLDIYLYPGFSSYTIGSDRRGSLTYKREDRGQ